MAESRKASTTVCHPGIDTVGLGLRAGGDSDGFKGPGEKGVVLRETDVEGTEGRLSTPQLSVSCSKPHSDPAGLR